MDLIDEEIKKGDRGRIAMKLNSITDIDAIRKLREASCAGVKIDLTVRGICCILPGVAGHTENITVLSIVGRFLEHARIYAFGTGDGQKVYISSADLMTRNTQRRVEVACPIFDEVIKDRINKMLEIGWRDNVKGRVMTEDGTYVKKDADGPPVDSQQYFMDEATEKEARPQEPESRFGQFLKKLRALFGGLA